jgi:biotin operon repressor
MKWTKEKMDLYLSMKMEGASNDEIAEMLGCSRQSVYNKTNELKKKAGGRMNAPKKHRFSANQPIECESAEVREELYEEIINSIDAGKTKNREKDMSCEEAILNTFLGSGRPESETQRNREGDMCDNGTHACDSENEGCDNAITSYAARFASMAHNIVKSAEYNGITPERVHIDTQPGFTCAELTGTDKEGNVCELRLTVMDAPTLSNVL